MTKTKSAVVFIIIFALAIVWDVIAIVTWGPQVTLSAIVWGLAKEMPIVPFALGIVMGHLFWPMAKDTMSDGEKKP